MHGDCFETEFLHESLQGVEADIGVVIELRDPSLVDRRNGVEPLGQNFPAEPRRCLKKCDVEKPNRCWDIEFSPAIFLGALVANVTTAGGNPELCYPFRRKHLRQGERLPEGWCRRALLLAPQRG